jgi:hypothetical protein
MPDGRRQAGTLVSVGTRADLTPEEPPRTATGLSGLGWAYFVTTVGIALFYYTSPAPGPRIGRTLAILGPRPGGAPSSGLPG